MNQVVEEMKAILEGDNYLAHIGVARRSGRYPWGSGENPYQHAIDFLGRVEHFKKQGLSERQIAEKLDLRNDKGEISTSVLRKEISWCTYDKRLRDVATAKSLKEDGLGATEIGRKMGINESTVRSLLNPNSEARMQKARETADFIKKQIDEKGMIDVGKDVERELGISRTKLDLALYALEREGYPVYSGGIAQPTNPGQQTTQKVICPPGTQHKDIYNLDQVHTLMDYTSRDDGKTFVKKFVYPESLDSKRLMIRYAEDGGVDRDGVIELRRGVEDLSLGESRYSQVRILVDKTHYLKGMAVYSDDMPDGVDVIFNTNKTKDKAMKDVLKEIKKDPGNPFGALIKENGGQSTYTDKNGKEKLSLINKTREEGEWAEWKDALPSQFLGKQSLSMAKKQLNLAKADKLDEFNDYCSLTNPTIKKHLLQKFADNCDAAAVNLQAAALPGQKYHVIIPINTLKDTEVYAPNYENGTKLALIRYPHGGTFEIPILTVNNKHAAARKLIGSDVIDAVGINKNVADRLSGADFDGDTVMAIPTHDAKGKVKIASKPPLKDLEGFDPKLEYGNHEVKTDSDGNKHYYRNGHEYPIMKNTGTQMGIISNLITDMTLAGANDTDLAKAVRHSMVVIDAEKHKLDYKQSAIDNDIATLHKIYQGKTTGGASTILSRSKGEQSVTKRQGSPKVNIPGKSWYDPTKPEGALLYKDADDATYVKTKVNKKTGEITEQVITKTQKSTRMAETDDPYTLVSTSKHPMELIYADYAASMKNLANQARKEMMTTGKINYDSRAKDIYREEVASLNTKLNTASLNSIREREALRRANVAIKAKTDADPNMKKEDIKKTSQKAVTSARIDVGAIARRDRNIEITDREWEAIQAGAVSETTLKKILNNTDIDKLRERATPRTTTTLNSAKVNRIKQLSASNYTLDEIARKLGVSTSVVSKYLKGAN